MNINSLKTFIEKTWDTSVETGQEGGLGHWGEANVCFVLLASGAAHCCERCIRTATAAAACVWNPWLGNPCVG